MLPDLTDMAAPVCEAEGVAAAEGVDGDDAVVVGVKDTTKEDELGDEIGVEEAVTVVARITVMV
jgi:hypothetical protein